MEYISVFVGLARCAVDSLVQVQSLTMGGGSSALMYRIPCSIFGLVVFGVSQDRFAVSRLNSANAPTRAGPFMLQLRQLGRYESAPAHMEIFESFSHLSVLSVVALRDHPGCGVGAGSMPDIRGVVRYGWLKRTTSERRRQKEKEER